MIIVQTVVTAPKEKIWQYWNEPDHIKVWSHGSPDWYTPAAKNDLHVGGGFVTTMSAKDNSQKFDFEGTYTTVVPYELIEYTIADGRNVRVEFHTQGNTTTIVESFDTESENSEEAQRQGWQMILDNFKAYVEKAASMWSRHGILIVPH